MRLVDGMTKDAWPETTAPLPERVHWVTWHVARLLGVHHLATPNYSYEKRQRELAKKRKAEEKAEEKRLRKSGKAGDSSNQEPTSDSSGTSDLQNSLEPSPPSPHPERPE